MGLLDKLGDAALNALDVAARYAEKQRERKAATEPAVEVPSAPETPRPPAQPKLGDANIPVQIYGRMTCPWTQRALRLLETRDIEHVYIELAAAGGYALVPRLMTTTSQRTVPYVYLRGRFIGGYNELDEIDRLGQLEEMIKSEQEREASGKPRVRIQVASRTTR